MTHSEISNQRHALETARREVMRKAMEAYDRETYWPARKLLHEACGAVGHNWRFSHHGPLGDPWFFCTACNLSKVERDA